MVISLSSFPRTVVDWNNPFQSVASFWLASFRRPTFYRNNPCISNQSVKLISFSKRNWISIICWRSQHRAVFAARRKRNGAGFFWRRGAGGRTRTGTPCGTWFWVIYSTRNTDELSPLWRSLTDTKSLANTTVFESDMQKSSASSAIFALFNLDGNFGFWRDIGGMWPTNRAQQHTQ